MSNDKNMSAVDVLAVIRSRANRFDRNGVAVVDETLLEAAAAVAELIEAHRNLLDYVLSEAEARDYNPPADTVIVADSMSALARAGGGK